jgi:hypothetical protein
MSMSSRLGDNGTIATRGADYRKVTERTIYRLAEAKKSLTVRGRGTLRFSRADIDHQAAVDEGTR